MEIVDPKGKLICGSHKCNGKVKNKKNLIASKMGVGS